MADGNPTGSVVVSWSAAAPLLSSALPATSNLASQQTKFLYYVDIYRNATDYDSTISTSGGTALVNAFTVAGSNNGTDYTTILSSTLQNPNAYLERVKIYHGVAFTHNPNAYRFTVSSFHSGTSYQGAWRFWFGDTMPPLKTLAGPGSGGSPQWYDGTNTGLDKCVFPESDLGIPGAKKKLRWLYVDCVGSGSIAIYADRIIQQVVQVSSTTRGRVRVALDSTTIGTEITCYQYRAVADTLKVFKVWFPEATKEPKRV